MGAHGRKERRRSRLSAKLVCVAMVGLGALLAAVPASQAIEIQFGEVSGQFDTTLSWGTAMRVSERNQAIVGMQNGGTAFSVNGDDGNLNYHKGDLFSYTYKASHELQLGWDRWSVFGRAYYFYDREVMDGATRRTELSDATKKEIGQEFKLLDAYLAGDFQLGDMFLTLRGGNQVLNWGEGTFIQNGINSMSTIDVAKLRIGGAQLKDALEALPMAHASINLNSRFTLEGFVPFKWGHTEIEPSGSFFSTNDFASAGGNRVLLGFGKPGIQDTVPNTGVGAPVGVDVMRADDHDASDGGEFGVALRWFEPLLNDTEFGFYFTRLHSRLPLISGWTGLLQEGLGTGNYAGTANYFREFPEDIDTYGVSMNTSLPGIPILGYAAFQGEFCYKKNQPIQVDDVELLFAALSPLDQFIGLGFPGFGFKQSQLCNDTPFGFDEYIQGYRRKDMMQTQFTVTQLFGPGLGADNWLFMSECGFQWVKDMEDPDVLRYEGPGTYTSANPYFTEQITSTGSPIQPGTEIDGFADDFAWGYRAVVRAELNNLIGAWTVFPILVWYHDVKGTSPSPVLNFIEGRKTITAALQGVYLAKLSSKLAYTKSFGGGRYNLLNDRDFVSLTLGYSF